MINLDHGEIRLGRRLIGCYVLRGNGYFVAMYDMGNKPGRTFNVAQTINSERVIRKIASNFIAN